MRMEVGYEMKMLRNEEWKGKKEGIIWDTPEQISRKGLIYSRDAFLPPAACLSQFETLRPTSLTSWSWPSSVCEVWSKAQHVRWWFMLWGETKWGRAVEHPGDGVGGSGCDFHRMIREDLSEDIFEQRQEGGEGGSQVPFWERAFPAEARKVQRSWVSGVFRRIRRVWGMKENRCTCYSVNEQERTKG